MGKKKVVQKSGGMSEAVISEKIATSAARKSSSKKIDKGTVYINASYNNTMITIADSAGNAVAWSSAGSLGFSGPKKATPFAASKVVVAVLEKIKKTGPFTVDVVVRGVGSGRDSALRALAAQGITIHSITDATPIPHNGPRPPKTRRV